MCGRAAPGDMLSYDHAGLAPQVWKDREVSNVGPGLVLLAAGRGSRLSELTDTTHKSLLSVAGRPALSRIISELAQGNFTEAVIVTGYRSEDISEFVTENHAGFVSGIAFNSRWEEDTNILSTEIGVTALSKPENGYLIVETDVALDARSWERIRSTVGGRHSIWYTRGRYSPDLTGGCLCADDASFVKELAYAPSYDQQYDGWHKLIGMLYVASSQVDADRSLRQRAIVETTRQYYLQPYIDHSNELPCTCVDLGAGYASSFNDLASYQAASDSLAEAGG